MRKYSKYKESGIEWIGDIPEGWEISRIKYLARGGKDSFIDGDWIESTNISESGIRYITTGNIGEGFYKEQGSGYITEETFSELNCTEVFEDDLVISRLSIPIGRCCLIPNLKNRIVTSVDNVILRPKNEIIKKFLVYQFNSKRFFEYTELIARGTTLTRISRTMLGNIGCIIPPLPEQQAIVSFLDDKTSQIDTLISNLQKKIELLKEKRTALINHAVTKGLEPKAKMKDSGVEWIGEIPEGWLRNRIRMLTKEHRQGFYSSSEYDDYGYKVVRITDIMDDHSIDLSLSPFYNLSVKDANNFQLMEGDFLFPRTGGVGRFGIFSSVIPSIYGSFLIRFRFKPSVISNYLKYYFSSELFINEISKEIHGGVNQNVHVENIKDCTIYYPKNQADQQEIVEYLDHHTAEIDKEVSLEEKRIELLKEYRQSLISEVVTGKINVSDYAIQPN